jgi:hypothetical protein
MLNVTRLVELLDVCAWWNGVCGAAAEFNSGLSFQGRGMVA